MMKTSIIDDARESALVLKAWLVSVLVIAILGSAKQDAGNNEHSVRKLVADEHPGFINIDCGATDNYTDNGTGFFYESDSRFIDTGTNEQIPSEYYAVPGVTRQLKTLRSFPERIKNCYTLKPTQGKNSNYLIRAVFYYANYDNKNQTQKFNVYVGVNYWATVELNYWAIYYEVIHAPSSDTIFVCLMNTQSEVPFISGLELRPVDKSIYLNDYSKALHAIVRVDLGNTSGSILVRYPDDVFDRLWLPTSDVFISKSVSIKTSSDIDTNDSNNIYKLPAQVLSTAIKPASGYTLRYDLSNYVQNIYYVCFHFAEIEEVKEGEIREFFIDVNEGNYISEPITLEYLKPFSRCPNKTFEGHFNFTINATAKSNLPPLLNALEIYRVLSLPYLPTDPGDVAAIMEIKQTSTRRDDWQGDPCVPDKFLWNGLTCSTDDTPRIISLNLSSSKLTGKMPSSLSNLKALES
ncbi:putative leucine-rich repeat receptor-like protein kinase, partial [Fagus crenata]